MPLVPAIQSRAVMALIDPRRKFSRAVLQATRDYARSKPWRGPLSAREGKLLEYHLAMCEAYGYMGGCHAGDTPKVGLSIDWHVGRDSGMSRLEPMLNEPHRPMGTIFLVGRKSVVTYLTMWAKVVADANDVPLNKWERFTRRYALALYARCFPRSWSRLHFEGYAARAPQRITDELGSVTPEEENAGLVGEATAS